MSKTERCGFGSEMRFWALAGMSNNQRLSVVVCPGFHPASLTDSFVRSLPPFVDPHVVRSFPADPFSTLQFIKQIFEEQPAVGIGFSGGVVGLVGALKIWQFQGGAIAKLLAVDGWGVPIVDLPVARISHDAFTHWSSTALGAKHASFYADPAVSHLTMWEFPERVEGWKVSESSGVNRLKKQREPMTVASFITHQLSELV